MQYVIPGRNIFMDLYKCGVALRLNARRLFVAALVLGASFAQTASYAQPDQKIVMRCTYAGYDNQTLDFVIDLAARTISGTHTIKGPNGSNVVQPIQATLTQVIDDQISWTFSDTNRSVTDTLNRYSGQIV